MAKQIFPIFWFTGNTGAGKSTLVFRLRETFNNEMDVYQLECARRVIVLDGDEMRATISQDEDLSAEGRRRHNLRVARLAKLLSDSGYLVLVSVIAPFAQLREEVAAMCNPLWIYVQRDGLQADDKPYEPPTSPDLLLDHNVLTVEQSYERCLEFILRQVQ